MEFSKRTITLLLIFSLLGVNVGPVVAADIVGAKNPLKQAVKGSLNKLGVTGKVAQAGKTKLIKEFEKHVDSNSAKEAAHLLDDLDMSKRTQFSELLDKNYISDSDIAHLVKNPTIFRKALTSESQAARQMILRDFC